MKLNKIVTELIEISEIGNSFELDQSLPSRSFGMPPNSIIFSGENKSRFEELVEKLYRHSSAIRDTLTLRAFTKDFINHFREHFENQTIPKKNDIDNFFDELKSEPVYDYYIFREIFGIKFETDISYLTFGDFTVYNFKKDKKPIEELFHGDIERVSPLEDPEFVVRYDAKARHFQKAKEKADKYFKRFEATLNFCIGKSRQHEIGILNYTGWQRNSAFVLNEEGTLSESYESDGPTQEVALDDEYFKNSDCGFDKIWNLISKENHSNIESRIILALDWIGQAINEKSQTDSFLKAAISLEILLTYNEKAPITPSITHRLSESTALLIGRNQESRIAIEKAIKKIYGKRSRIVHSGKHSVEDKDIAHILAYVKEIIIALLTKPDLKSINNIQELYSHLKKLKYSYK